MWKFIKNCDAIILGMIGFCISLGGFIWIWTKYNHAFWRTGLNDMTWKDWNPILLIIFGSIFILVSWVSIRLDIINPLRQKQLEKTGRWIKAQILKIEPSVFTGRRGEKTCEMESLFSI